MVYENEQIQAMFDKLTEGCDKAIEFMKSEFSIMRVGRANSRILDRIMVDYWGTPTLLVNMCNISSPDPRTLVLSLWDKSALKATEKAILAANIGINPVNDGTIIRLAFPEVTEERRKDLVKQAKKMCEDTKVVIRNERRESMEKLKKLKTDKALSEDLIADYEKEVDKVTNKNIEITDKLSKEKEKDIMSV
ncbi:MAG: ribosome recycling factor [Clostridia bacterium]